MEPVFSNGGMGMKSFQEQKQAKWRQIIDTWRASELGVNEFCRRHDVEAHRLYYWRRRLSANLEATSVKSRCKQPALKFLPVQVKDVPTVGMSCSNVPVPPRIEVFCSNGTLIRVSGQLSDDNVVGIMKLAAGASC